jgi:hypothetical protein
MEQLGIVTIYLPNLLATWRFYDEQATQTNNLYLHNLMAIL